VSDAPDGSSRVPELLKLRALDLPRIAILLGIAAIVVVWLLAIPGTRLAVFVATVVALVVFLALALTRLRAVRRVIVDRLADLPEETAVVALVEAIPLHRSPLLLLQREADGLRFEHAADPAQTALLTRADIRSVAATTFPSCVAVSLADGTLVRLGIVTPKLSTPRPVDLERLRDWMTKGSPFPADLGAGAFAREAR
jgi:hypothetical protein